MRSLLALIFVISLCSCSLAPKLDLDKACLRIHLLDWSVMTRSSMPLESLRTTTATRVSVCEKSEVEKVVGIFSSINFSNATYAQDDYRLLIDIVVDDKVEATYSGSRGFLYNSDGLAITNSRKLQKYFSDLVQRYAK